MLKKLTTLLIVDAIEPQLPIWQKLGYETVTRVPDTGALGFVILKGNAGELMLQTKASIKEDIPDIAKRNPAVGLYADVDSITKTQGSLSGAELIVDQRKTFYGATESWFVLPGGTVLGLAEHD